MSWLTVKPNRRQHLLDDFNDFDRMFEDMFRGFGPLMAASSVREQAFFAPSIDVKETENGYEIHAELPGMNENDVSVDVTDGVLTLQGEKKAAHEETKDNITRMERRYGSFKRQFQLPETVDVNGIDAAFKNGVLTLNLPKQALPEQQVKKIQIKST